MRKVYVAVTVFCMFSSFQLSSQVKEGVNGWTYSTSPDPMTDIMFSIFMKTSIDSNDEYVIVVRHVPSKSYWDWGIGSLKGTKWETNKKSNYSARIPDKCLGFRNF